MRLLFGLRDPNRSNAVLTTRGECASRPLMCAAMLDSIYRNILLPPVRRVTRDDAETAHEWFLTVMRQIERRPAVLAMLRRRFQPDPMLSQTLMDGLVFPSPFGVAAGLDKNASILRSLEALTSPGFIEVGTVTPRPQEGNPRPRIVRVDRDNMINAMGFPNDGAEAAIGRLLLQGAFPMPIGLNIGKMKETTEEAAPNDYGQIIAATATLRKARSLPDFYVINISSPNTPGLTAMQKVEPLSHILGEVTQQLDALSFVEQSLRHRLLVKIGPDLEPADIDSIVRLVVDYDIGGIVATNTTTTRPVKGRHADRAGGFSGSALYDRSSRTIRHVASLLPRHKVLVATGGIDTVDRAFEMLRFADLVGAYTGLVLQGPHLLRMLSRGVAERMQAIGISSLSELRAEQRPS